LQSYLSLIMKASPILILIFSVLGCVTIADGQHFNAGLRLGANFAQIDGDRMEGYNLGGIVGGVFVSYPFKDKWEGQFEMLFSQKGSQRVINADTIQPGDWDLLRINYIEVPIMVNYRLSQKIKLCAGIGGAYMISNHFETTNNVIMNNIDGITKGELSGTGGFQYYFTPKFSVYARFTYSLLGINQHGGQLSYYVYSGGLANNVVSFGGYYSFIGDRR
jgi:hypothetical protein